MSESGFPSVVTEVAGFGCDGVHNQVGISQQHSFCVICAGSQALQSSRHICCPLGRWIIPAVRAATISKTVNASIFLTGTLILHEFFNHGNEADGARIVVAAVVGNYLLCSKASISTHPRLGKLRNGIDPRLQPDSLRGRHGKCSNRLGTGRRGRQQRGGRRCRFFCVHVTKELRESSSFPSWTDVVDQTRHHVARAPLCQRAVKELMRRWSDCAERKSHGSIDWLC